MQGIRPEFLTPEGFLVEGLATAADTAGGESVFAQSFLEASLYSFGEDDALDLVRAGLTRSEVAAIGALHCELESEADPASKTGRGYAGDKALALAAVAVLEGQARPLARKRRRPQNS